MLAQCPGTMAFKLQPEKHNESFMTIYSSCQMARRLKEGKHGANFHIKVQFITCKLEIVIGILPWVLLIKSPFTYCFASLFVYNFWYDCFPQFLTCGFKKAMIFQLYFAPEIFSLYLLNGVLYYFLQKRNVVCELCIQRAIFTALAMWEVKFLMNQLTMFIFLQSFFYFYCMF